MSQKSKKTHKTNAPSISGRLFLKEAELTFYTKLLTNIVVFL